jgi:hypothetical protein
MKRLGLVFLVAGLVLAGTGCARRSGHAAVPGVAFINLAIPVRCASEITLMKCDARVSPPKCKSVRVRYRSGCEEIVVGRR